LFPAAVKVRMISNALSVAFVTFFVFPADYIQFSTYAGFEHYVYTVSSYFEVGLLCVDFDDRFDHARIVREHYVFLVDNLDAKHSGLVGELYQAEVLNAEEWETTNSEVISFTQNEKLLSMLSRKTKDQFDEFLDALDNTGQRYVRDRITGRQRQLFCCGIQSD